MTVPYDPARVEAAERHFDNAVRRLQERAFSVMAPPEAGICKECDLSALRCRGHLTRTRQTTLSRGMDYLGTLGARLRDLRGHPALIHELIQNANDADGARKMVFDLREDALLVENDGRFSGCRQLDQDECPWAQEGRPPCDFHGFRSVGDESKRGRKDTTGAFGIGFTARVSDHGS